MQVLTNFSKPGIIDLKSRVLDPLSGEILASGSIKAHLLLFFYIFTELHQIINFFGVFLRC
jgi:hypothetical protein